MADTERSAYKQGTLIGYGIAVGIALALALAFGLGLLVGEHRVEHGVKQEACHLVGGHWWTDRSKCVDYVSLPR